MFDKTILSVSGMHCEHCEHRVETAVSSVVGVRGVKADAEKGIVRVKCGKNPELLEKVKDAIRNSGYDVNDGKING